MTNQSQSDCLSKSRISSFSRFGRRMMFLFGMSMCGLASWASAQINERSVAPIGLEVMWENSIGGAGLAQGIESLAVWPHSKDRREYVDIFVGNRLIERIDARRVDREALDKRILSGKNSDEVPVLGLEGAKAQAEKLVKTYAVLGKKATVKVVSQPLTYVIGLASNGLVTAIDGETGELL